MLTIIIALADAAFLDRFTELGDEPLPEGIAMGLGFLALALSIVAWSASSMASGLIQGGPALGVGSVFGTAITAGATAGAIGTGIYHAGRGLAAGAGALGRLAVAGGGGSASGATGRASGPTPRLGGPARPALTGPTTGSTSPGSAGGNPPSNAPSGLLPGPSDGGSNPSSGGGQLPVPAGAEALGAAGSMSAQSEAATGSAAGGASFGAGAGNAAGATGGHGISTETLARHVGGRTSDEPWGTRPRARGTLGRAAALGVAHALYSDRSSGGMRGPDFERE